MPSSDRTGAQGKAVAAEPPIAPVPAAGADGEAADPWFAPGPKQAAAATGGSESADWFLRTGRAGLLPDSMTESTDAWQDSTLPHPDRSAHAEAAGSPPWAPEPTEAAAGVLPPWETGPWPGPGGQPASRQDPPPSRLDPPPSRLDSPAAAGDPATAAVNASRRPVQLALAAGIAVVVLVVIIVVIVTTAGGPAGGCGTYPAAVKQAYDRAMSDLLTHAPASVQSAAFAAAASRANASAAAAGQIGVRTAMFAMAGDLDQAHADLVANRPLPASLRQHLAADGTAPASCGG
jgi:hypothetical protein